MRIQPFKMSPTKAADVVIARYGITGAHRYIWQRIQAAGQANYSRWYVRVLEIVDARHKAAATS